MTKMNKYIGWTHVQDIRVCRDVGLGYWEDEVKVNGVLTRKAYNRNPGVTYIEDPMSLVVGDVIQDKHDEVKGGLVIVSIEEHSQGTRTIYFDTLEDSSLGDNK